MKKMIYLVLVFISTSSFADDKSLGYLEKIKRTVTIDYTVAFRDCVTNFTNGGCSIPFSPIKKPEELRKINEPIKSVSIDTENGVGETLATLYKTQTGGRIDFVFRTKDGSLSFALNNANSDLVKKLFEKPISFEIDKPYKPAYLGTGGAGGPE